MRSLALVGCCSVVLAAAGCDPTTDAQPTGFSWTARSVAGPVVAETATAYCRLPERSDLEAHFQALADGLFGGAVISALDPVRLSDANLATAVDVYLSNLHHLRFDDAGAPTLARGIPRALPSGLDDYRSTWEQLYQAQICGASVVTWDLPMGQVSTLAWIIDSATFHESISDHSVLVEAASLAGRRTDGDCGSAHWIGSSVGRESGLGVGTHFSARFGLCGVWLDEERTDLGCTEPSPTVDGFHVLGGFSCEQPVPQRLDDCCAAAMSCSLTMGFEGFGAAWTTTAVAMACPSPVEPEPEEPCDDETEY